MVKLEDLEIWDYIKGYENYKVSSKGRIWSINNDKLLKPSPDVLGYHKVKLYKDGKPKSYTIHRLVALTFYFVDDDDDENKLIDHIDQEKTNNNLLNLRFCSKSENQRNKDLYSNNKSGYKGVTWKKHMQKWIARININKKSKHLGYFDTKEEAYEVYKKASKELHGEFGYAP